MLTENNTHFLVPKHIPLPKQQAEELLKRLGIRIELLPQILRDDPAIEERKLEKNTIIKIIRDSPTAGKTVYYRRVV